MKIHIRPIQTMEVRMIGMASVFWFKISLLRRFAFTDSPVTE
jgi:hypothetical protein